MTIQGIIKKIGETQAFGASGFRKRDLVVTTSEQYPQMILVEFVQDKCDVLNAYKVGDTVTIAINLRGREWINPDGEAKYFNSIVGWRIEKSEQSVQSSGTTTQPPTPSGDEDNDLPF